MTDYIVFPAGRVEVYRAIVVRLLQAMSDKPLRRNIYGLAHAGVPIHKAKTPSPDPLGALRYSCVYWTDHFCDRFDNNYLHEQSDLCDGDKVYQFLKKFYLYWIEALSLL